LNGYVALNIPIVNVAEVDGADAEAKKNYMLQIGVLSSALEHAVPEQMFADPDPAAPRPDAISAVKALSKASAAGQRIYHLTQANQASTLANIHHDSATMVEIRDALAVGKEVITHTNAVSVPGWSGAGYIVLDPDTGSGAYKISGGANGGFFVILGFIGLAAAMFFTTVVMIAQPFSLLAFALWAASQGLLFLQAIAFGEFVMDVGASGCSDEEKSDAVSAAAFMFVLEGLGAKFFSTKILESGGIKKEFYEVLEIVLGAGGLAVLGELATTLNQYRVDSCN
jgi:hypothetical protein